MSSSESSPASTVRRTGGVNLEPIMSAAEQAFAEQGFYGASMRTIARTAGTSLSNLYNYFPSKDDLLLGVLERANGMLEARIADALAGAGPTATERLRAAVTAYVGFSVDHRQAAVVALSEFRYLHGDRRAQLVEARDRTQAIFQEITRDGMASGEFGTRLERDATRAVLLLCATVPNWYRASGELTREKVADMQADFALSIVGARQG
ncbi:TetR/AcrR family transcriptional regulator [Streptomyces sp. NPDC004629]|uniref:TetR/AcrR family transcriptional regulator n=1 Tax=Streptomyces sp. NPDC004629 TaxID=3364705 RepID=UPI0036A4094C